MASIIMRRVPSNLRIPQPSLASRFIVGRPPLTTISRNVFSKVLKTKPCFQFQIEPSSDSTGVEDNSNQALGGNGGGPRWKDVNALLRLIRFIRNHLLASSVYTVSTAFIIYVCQHYWSKSHQQSIYKSRHQLHETKTYQNLIDGPCFPDPKGALVPRKASQDELGHLIIPNSIGGYYSLVVGQQG